METTKITTAKAAIPKRVPQFLAAGVLTGSLVLGADNVLSLSLTAASFAVAEVARARFGVRSLRPSVTRAANSQLGPVAGRVP
jgi:hypothetical protein